jgi:hypothetical protein
LGILMTRNNRIYFGPRKSGLSTLMQLGSHQTSQLGWATIVELDETTDSVLDEVALGLADSLLAKLLESPARLDALFNRSLISSTNAISRFIFQKSITDRTRLTLQDAIQNTQTGPASKSSIQQLLDRCPQGGAQSFANWDSLWSEALLICGVSEMSIEHVNIWIDITEKFSLAASHEELAKLIRWRYSPVFNGKGMTFGIAIQASTKGGLGAKLLTAGAELASSDYMTRKLDWTEVSLRSVFHHSVTHEIEYYLPESRIKELWNGSSKFISNDKKILDLKPSDWREFGDFVASRDENKTLPTRDLLLNDDVWRRLISDFFNACMQLPVVHFGTSAANPVAHASHDCATVIVGNREPLILTRSETLVLQCIINNSTKNRFLMAGEIRDALGVEAHGLDVHGIVNTIRQKIEPVFVRTGRGLGIERANKDWSMFLHNTGQGYRWGPKA